MHIELNFPQARPSSPASQWLGPTQTMKQASNYSRLGSKEQRASRTGDVDRNSSEVKRADTALDFRIEQYELTGQERVGQ